MRARDRRVPCDQLVNALAHAVLSFSTYEQADDIALIVASCLRNVVTLKPWNLFYLCGSNSSFTVSVSLVGAGAYFHILTAFIVD